MSRLIELMHLELLTFDAVMEYRSRSFYLFLAALVAGPTLGLLLAHLLSQTIAGPGMAKAVQPLAALLALVLTLKLLLLATRTYLKDRARLLRL